MRDWEGGSEVRPQVRIPVWLCSSRLPYAIGFSVKEKDETRLARVCGRGPLNTFILALPEFEGFLLFGTVSALSSASSRRDSRALGRPPKFSQANSSNFALVSQVKTVPRRVAGK